MESKMTSTGKAVKSCSLKDEKGVLNEDVSIWSDFPDFSNLRAGSHVSGQIKSNAKGYKSLYPELTKGFTSGTYKTPTMPPRTSGVVSAAKITSESVKVAQERKNESIAYFNSLNSAIALVTKWDTFQTRDADELKESIRIWRDFFLEEWQKYEASDARDKSKPF